MAKRDLFFMTSRTQSIAPAALTSSANGTAADMQFWRSAQMVVASGLYTDGTHTFTMQDSPDNSVWTDVAAGSLQFTAAGGITASGTILIDSTTVDNQDYQIGYMGNERYARVEYVAASTTTGAVASASIEMGHPSKKGKLNS
jgi:hypothetical protein